MNLNFVFVFTCNLLSGLNNTVAIALFFWDHVLFSITELYNISIVILTPLKVVKKTAAVTSHQLKKNHQLGKLEKVW